MWTRERRAHPHIVGTRSRVNSVAFPLMAHACFRQHRRDTQTVDAASAERSAPWRALRRCRCRSLLPRRQAPALGSHDKTVKLWTPASGQMIRAFGLHPESADWVNVCCVLIRWQAGDLAQQGQHHSHLECSPRRLACHPAAGGKDGEWVCRYLRGVLRRFGKGRRAPDLVAMSAASRSIRLEKFSDSAAPIWCAKSSLAIPTAGVKAAAVEPISPSCSSGRVLDHDPIKLNRDHGLAFCLSMIFFRKPGSPLFGSCSSVLRGRVTTSGRDAISFARGLQRRGAPLYQTGFRYHSVPKLTIRTNYITPEPAVSVRAISTSDRWVQGDDAKRRRREHAPPLSTPTR